MATWFFPGKKKVSNQIPSRKVCDLKICVLVGIARIAWVATHIECKLLIAKC
jgi:hypothetical protein